MKVKATNGTMSLTAYQGDAKTLLAFDLSGKKARANLAGFTIRIQPPGGQPFYLQNNLRFEKPADHAQDPQEPAFSSLNAPIHKFRWVHVPGLVHQGLKPAFGNYSYTVTPRYFDSNGSLQPIDPDLGVSAVIEVGPFKKGSLRLGFTRGYTQSQAFVRHFGLKAAIRPKDSGLLFDTSLQSGTNAAGEKYTYRDQYEWLGFTARRLIFDLLDEVVADKSLEVDVFAYDLNEPDLIAILLELGKEKRARIILDDAALHHDKTKPKPEDEFEALFAKAAGASRIKRGNFDRYAHDKVFIVKDAGGARRVLTGSTNFSVTGFYVNSNHVLVFDDRAVASAYAGVFEQVWNDNVKTGAFIASKWSTGRFPFGSAKVPATEITFSPHNETDAGAVLKVLVDRVAAEDQVAGGKGSVLFAVMQLDGGKINPVYTALNALHRDQNIFSYGISDTPDGISLYPLGKKNGVLVTGKPVRTQLPPPFNQVPNVGLGHQIHHKFVVCGFNGADPTVFCGSSNLALAGEQVNGDNLLVIRDGDVATAFAIEALALVDHFDFLDRTALGPKPKTPPALKQQAAVAKGWFLSTSGKWADKYFDKKDLHCIDRELFA